MNAKDTLIEHDLHVLLKGETAPDLSHATLQRAEQGEAPVLAEPRRQRSRLKWRRVAEAVVIVVAVGLMAWLVVRPTPPVEPERLWAAGPGSIVTETDTGLRLEQGWLLLKPEAPEVSSGESKLTKIRGLVLARAGNAPTAAEWEAIQPWLQQNQLEEEMLKATKWAQGLAMAVLIFTGTAILDGQEVEAPEAETQSEPVWHTVRTVVEIENLPKGATHVRANGLDGAYLEFFNEVEGLEALDFRNGKLLTPAHMEALAKITTLTHLDLRHCSWVGGDMALDYRALEDAESLTWFGAEIQASGRKDETEAARENRLDTVYHNQLIYLRSLHERGVDLHVSMTAVLPDVIQHLHDLVPALKAISLAHANDRHLELIARFKELTHLDLPQCYATELGFAFLARGPKLRTLNAAGSKDLVTPDIMHHISRMTTLETLELNSRVDDAGLAALGMISRLRALRELRFGNLIVRTLSYQPGLDKLELHPLEEIGPLAKLELDSRGVTVHDPSLIWTIAGACAMTELAIRVNDARNLAIAEFDRPKWFSEDAANRLAVLNLQLGSDALYARQPATGGKVGDGVLAALRLYPNLARIELGWMEDGAPGSADDLDGVAAQLREAFPEMEIEVVK